mmetsp:Transcript_83717/g.167182  ORF Transcript_83717/g.167182 Transcript_83717/m.167182 type:complete len:81 (+) Transcript_83717:88-330(+)
MRMLTHAHAQSSSCTLPSRKPLPSLSQLECCEQPAEDERQLSHDRGLDPRAIGAAIVRREPARHVLRMLVRSCVPILWQH